ncbi:hypothetical protein [Streptomyces sp. NPDC020917]|uniref:hypothetical protein n=1 Tax=Streptomyces sp. NPDC020917 TaxID=3365102 RepID=UPI0037AB5EA9
MTVTLRITLPDLVPPQHAARVLRGLVPLAVPALLAAVDASGMGLPARLLLHAAAGAAQRAAAAPAD